MKTKKTVGVDGSKQIGKGGAKGKDGSLVMKFKPIEGTIKRAVKRPEITVDESFKIKWDEIEIPNIKEWNKSSCANCQMTKNGSIIMVDDDGNCTACKRIIMDMGKTINYWKYACIAILLGLVAGMIISTPFIINAVEVCSQ